MPLAVRRPRRRPSVAALTAGLAAVAFVATLVGCTDDNGGETRDAAELLSAAADEMAAVETTRLLVTTEGGVTELPVRQVEGVLTRAGDADGTAQLEQLGALVELSFVVVDDTFYFQLLGGWQEMPLAQASMFYDPSAILDPDRGLPNMLRTAGDPEIEERETVDGVETYRVTGELGAGPLGTLLPGISQSAPGTMWIGVDRPLLYRVEVAVPEGDGGGTADVRLSDFDAPVEISAP